MDQYAYGWEVTNNSGGGGYWQMMAGIRDATGLVETSFALAGVDSGTVCSLGGFVAGMDDAGTLLIVFDARSGARLGQHRIGAAWGAAGLACRPGAGG